MNFKYRFNMKQFLVTGVLIAPEKINDELLQTHMAYT